jgi:RNA polymerase-binding transcription factor DksA
MPIKKKTAPKKAAKKSATKKAAVKKKTAQKTAAQKSGSAKKAAKQTEPKSASDSNATPINDSLKKTAISRSEVSSSKKVTPIVFSLDDVAELMAAKKTEATETKNQPDPAKKVAKAPEKPTKTVVDDKPVEKRSHAAASLADILGFNPAEKKKRTELDDSQIPKKFKKYYKLLIDLRRHVSDEINLHTSDTLKHSSRDDSGDSSGYGNHQADAGTDSFDRDFALSLVSSEQEALNEIEEAILRIKDGSYGVCAVTGKAIPAARLTAVPFARYSVEGQLEHERNQQRKHNRSVSGGIFGDVSDAPKIQSSDDDDDE